MNPSDTKRTVLYESHVSLGARMAPFGGYEMPIQYQGIFAAAILAAISRESISGELVMTSIDSRMLDFLNATMVRVFADGLPERLAAVRA